MQEYHQGRKKPHQWNRGFHNIRIGFLLRGQVWGGCKLSKKIPNLELHEDKIFDRIEGNSEGWKIFICSIANKKWDSKRTGCGATKNSKLDDFPLFWGQKVKTELSGTGIQICSLIGPHFSKVVQKKTSHLNHERNTLIFC